MAWPAHIEALVAADGSNRRRGPLLTLDQFFDDNTDLGSICCNLMDHPGLDVVRQRLEAILARPDVSAAWVEIVDDDRDLDWPFSDRVWFSTSASETDADGWREALEADEVIGPDPQSDLEERAAAGEQIIGLWWD